MCLELSIQMPEPKQKLLHDNIHHLETNKKIKFSARKKAALAGVSKTAVVDRFFDGFAVTSDNIFD